MLIIFKSQCIIYAYKSGLMNGFKFGYILILLFVTKTGEFESVRTLCILVLHYLSMHLTHRPIKK